MAVASGWMPGGWPQRELPLHLSMKMLTAARACQTP